MPAPTIAIIDYGVGNLRSVQKAFAAEGHEAIVTRDAGAIRESERVVLPGVGAFGAAIDTLRASGLESVTLDAAHSGRPFLGICVGMQLLFSEGEEMGRHRGLDLVPGRVLRFDEANLGPAARGVKVPQIGWNALRFTENGRQSGLFAGLENANDGAMVYFVHSYFCAPDSTDTVAATTDFIAPYCSAVARGTIYGVQFHPEKSGTVGLRILDNFARMPVPSPVPPSVLTPA
ncbi:MAG: imidazole glycerol phosphate synthase subunit HisH [Cytophagales bacterium]|nr:imidazole glycerol phosphate synthase subunit HisH [Armatimonadota bacterium]